MNDHPDTVTPPDTTQDQIRDLRAQLDALLAKRVEPALRDAAEQLSEKVEQATKRVQDETETAAAHIRQRPITAVLAAAAIGFVIARLAR